MYTLYQLAKSPMYCESVCYIFKKESNRFILLVDGVRLCNLDNNKAYQTYKHNEIAKIYPLANQREPSLKILLW